MRRKMRRKRRRKRRRREEGRDEEEEKSVVKWKVLLFLVSLEVLSLTVSVWHFYCLGAV